MKGLLLKDFYIMKKSFRTVLIIMVLYGIFGIMLKQISFLAAMLAMVCAIMPVSSFSYDDYAKWDSYALSMPVTRKQIILSKYLFGISMTVFGSLLALAFGFLSRAINGAESVKLADLFSSTGAVALICLLMLAIVLPLVVKMGAEKGRIAMIAVFLIPTLVVVMAARMGLIDRLPTGEALEQLIQTLIIAVPIVVILLLFLSVLISMSIYSKKEF